MENFAERTQAFGVQEWGKERGEHCAAVSGGVGGFTIWSCMAEETGWKMGYKTAKARISQH